MDNEMKTKTKAKAKTKAKESLKVEKGIVGFFDILGYTSFLENNTAEEAAKEVLNTLSSIDQAVINEYLGPDAKDFQKGFAKRLSCLVFSDTILLSYTYAKSKAKDKNLDKMLEWIAFFNLSVQLFKKLFDYGLPIRGAIGYGEFVTKEHCFAGKPIIDTYKDAHSIELSACVLSSTAEVEIEKIKQEVTKKDYKDDKVLSEALEFLIKIYCIKYLTLHKNNESRQRILLNVFAGKRLPSGKIDDMRQYVLEKFWKHNKDIPQSAQIKVENTEQFFRFLKEFNSD